MLYKPNFCCHCGEKVERMQWKLWTSQRFCENCEKDFRREEWSPTFLLGLSMLFGLIGFGSFLKTPEKPLTIGTNQFGIRSSNRTQNVKALRNGPDPNVPNTERPGPAMNQDSAKEGPQKPQKAALNDQPQDLSAEPVYFCGAQTKKGTACTRKVKGGGRCWQHAGQPAMLPKEKLVITQ